MIKFRGLAKLAAVAALGLFTLAAQANVVRQVELDFTSGARYTGTVTFSDDYIRILDTQGVLNGGGWTNRTLSWTWLAYTGQAAYDSNGDGYQNDWLMDGSSPNYSLFIGVSWRLPTAGADLAFVSVVDSYYSGISNGDAMVASRVEALDVPEPGQLGLVGIALAAAAFSMRRRRA
ncbi:hypothetical protein ABE85_11225 [Mitsuaria sp. 7]|nr:hypothetical protein ABE85_11225 [Mitsuaria sp. 7]